MLLIVYILMFIFGAFLLYIGTKNESFPALYLGMFTMLLFGIMLMQFGVDLESGIIYTDTATTIEGVIQYNTLTTANNWFVLLAANSFFYLSFIGIILSTITAINSSFLSNYD